MDSSGHKGWHSRGYLPHLDTGDELQALTYRLEDSLPRKVVERWREELEHQDETPWAKEQELRERIARYEDAGHGECLLRDHRCAESVENAMLFFDEDRYRLLEWCVMPNHVHVMIRVEQGNLLGEIVKSWKTFTAKEINRLLGRRGELWARDYHDRYIRDERHLNNARSYIRENPVKAGLCERPEDWRWSSAWSG